MKFPFMREAVLNDVVRCLLLALREAAPRGDLHFHSYEVYFSRTRIALLLPSNRLVVLFSAVVRRRFPENSFYSYSQTFSLKNELWLRTLISMNVYLTQHSVFSYYTVDFIFLYLNQRSCNV